MPDPSGLVLVLLLAVLAGAFVVAPLFARAAPPRAAGTQHSDDLASLALRHRIAVESLRDVEADHRAGTVDDAAYLGLRAEAEDRAATSLAVLESARAAGEISASPGAEAAHSSERSTRGARRLAALLAGALLIMLLVGSALPAPLSIANTVVVNAAEQARQAQIAQLVTALTAKPNDPPRIVELAGLLLQGGTDLERRRGAELLLQAVRLDPGNADAYRLLIGAYISAGDYLDAAAATEAYAKVAGTSPDIPFFRGLIALQGTGDRTAAIRWFDRFLSTAPDDPRSAMVRALRAEAAAGQSDARNAPSAKPSPSG
jgi:tetratricopeptide (TPR) repeat protein